MRLNPAFAKVFGGTVALLSFGVGAFVLFGLVLPENVSSTFRWMGGSVMVLYGIYRGVLLFIELKQAPRDEQTSDRPNEKGRFTRS